MNANVAGNNASSGAAGKSGADADENNQSVLQSVTNFARQATNSFIPGSGIAVGSQLGPQSSGIEGRESQSQN